MCLLASTEFTGTLELDDLSRQENIVCSKVLSKRLLMFCFVSSFTHPSRQCFSFLYQPGSWTEFHSSPDPGVIFVYVDSRYDGKNGSVLRVKDEVSMTDGRKGKGAGRGSLDFETGTRGPSADVTPESGGDVRPATRRRETRERSREVFVNGGRSGSPTSVRSLGGKGRPSSATFPTRTVLSSVTVRSLLYGRRFFYFLVFLPY